MATDWKKFERLVAAVHVMENDGATVIWNDEIGGRQFDVTIRFEKAGYNFLAVIECKDYATAVTVERIDALVTKARDAHADKAIMVAANGFQSGALTVARRHNVTLMSMASMKESETVLAKSLSPILFLSNVRFDVDSVPPGIIIVSDNPRHMRSIMRNTSVVGPGIDETVASIMDKISPSIQKESTGTTQTYRLEFPKGTSVTHQNFPGHLTPIKAIIVDHELITGADLFDIDYFSDDPRLSKDILRFENLIANESKLIDISKLRHGFDTVVEAGHFYINPNLGNSYYVESIDGDIVTYIVVESYSFGLLNQLTYRQDIKYSYQFVPIVNEREITRLAGMLDEYKKSCGSGS